MCFVHRDPQERTGCPDTLDREEKSYVFFKVLFPCFAVDCQLHPSSQYVFTHLCKRSVTFGVKKGQTPSTLLCLTVLYSTFVFFRVSKVKWVHQGLLESLDLR